MDNFYGSRMFFNDSIYVLDISQDEPALVHTLPTELSYLSGIVFDGRDLWVSEYENNEIHRLNPNVKRDVAKLLGAEPAQPGFVEASPSEERRKDSYVNSNAEYPDENISVHEFSAEIIGGAIYASWKIHFGEKLFSSESEQSSMMPVFARYVVSVTGPSLSQAVQETYEARDGMNEESEVELMRVAEQGTYNVSLFIHVQYIRPDGGYQILNKSAAPLTLQW